MDLPGEGGHGDRKRVQRGGSDLLTWRERLYGVALFVCAVYVYFTVFKRLEKCIKLNL